MTLQIKPFSHPKYRPDIDGLRAIAVLSVVAYHAFPEWIKGGFIGVDIFFVISGYLISTIIYENLEKGTFSFSIFYARRIKRIFPALILVLISVYLLGWFALIAQEFMQLNKHMMAGVGFVSNFVLINESGYFDTDVMNKSLLHLWSLGIEEQFYLMWPLMLWLIWIRKYNIFFISLFLIALSFFLNLSGVKQDVISTFYSPQTRFWELLSGSLLAWIKVNKLQFETHIHSKFYKKFWGLDFFNFLKVNKQILINTLSIIGMLFLVYGFIKINKYSHFPGKLALFPVLGTVLIIYAGVDAWLNKVVLSNKLIVWFGLISFPLYLWHWPILSFTYILSNQELNCGDAVIAVGISVLFAWITYRFVERPIRFSNNKKIVYFLSISMLIIFVVSAITYENKGFADSYKKPTNLQELVTRPWPKTESFDCAKYFPDLGSQKFDGGCKLTKDEAPSIAFVGDSHTAQYRNGIYETFKSESVLILVQTSCLPFVGKTLSNNSCKSKQQASLDVVSKSTSIKTVVLSGYWAYLMSGGFDKTGRNWRIPRELTDDEQMVFRQNAIKFISELVKNQKQIIFIKDIPDIDFNIRECFDFRPLQFNSGLHLNKHCVMDYPSFVKRNATYDEVVHNMLTQFPEVRVYDPRPLFCSDTECKVMEAGLPYYFNGDHLNHIGATLVIKDMAKTLGLTTNSSN